MYTISRQVRDGAVFNAHAKLAIVVAIAAARAIVVAMATVELERAVESGSNPKNSLSKGKR